METLTGHGWEPQHELMKYIKKNRMVN